MQHSKFKTTAIILLISLHVFGLFLFARPVHAQGDAPILIQWEEVSNALLAGALGGVMEGISYFMRKLAYDGAKYIAYGGKGQGALAFQDGFGAYITKVQNDTAATMLNEFAKNSIGLDICAPPDIQQMINLTLSFSRIYGEGGPAPSCEWNKFKESWSEDNLNAMYGSTDALSERFAASLSVVEGDFGVALHTQSKLDKIVNDAVNGALNDRLEGSGFKAVKDVISGNVKTPSQVVAYETEALTAKDQSALSAEQVAGIYGAGVLQIIPSTLSVFANTFIGSLMDQLFDDGLLPDDSGGASAADYYASTLNTNREAAERVFSFLIAAVPQRSLTAYDIVTQYSSCPSSPGLNNCVMDLGLVAAINRSKTEQPITIAEALADGTMLHPNWKLISKDDPTKNTDKNCHSYAYCYSNVQKLRRARILPLGFEIAVANSPSDNPWTLGEVLAGFSECPKEGESADSDRYKFCHLIDPNWVIKAPEARCEAEVNGPLLESDGSSTRARECADISTCLASDDTGSCVAYGYCTQEKNVWRIPGASCPEQYNTCKTYTNNTGVYASYLSRTLDYGTCNIESVGCTPYVTERKPSNTDWIGLSQVEGDIDKKKNGYPGVLYFNDQISAKTCPEEADGCSLFIDASTTQPIHLKKAPIEFACYDTNKTDLDIDWPQTTADLQLLADRPEACAQFAGACIPEEVGCLAYTPQDGSSVVTGLVGNNFCPAQCVGYETFKQESSNFEAEQFPLYFVPSTGESCSAQYAGCDEFTNVGDISGETREYYTDLKYCQQPDSENAKVFYSWEGSESQGYILKKHNLAQISVDDATTISSMNISGTGYVASTVFPAGSPMYVNDSPAELQENYDLCNQTSYNRLIDNPYSPAAAHPDCRALYDTSGTIFYRLLKETVTVSPFCQPLRKTDSQMYVDAYYSGSGKEAGCKAKGGVYEGTTCNRCFDGGIWQADGTNPNGGACIYYTIPSEATSCPATANSCRMYIGNTGNNIYEVYSTSFEPVQNEENALLTAKKGWSSSGSSVVPEATQVGLYSLKFEGNKLGYQFAPGVLKKGLSYELSFWARGEPQGLMVRLAQNGDKLADNNFTLDPLTQTNVFAPITLEWQQYTLGPVLFSGDTQTTTTLEFSRNVSDDLVYFLDNIRLVSMGSRPDDYLPLIKNSWKTIEGYEVPLACDSTPLDAYPGEALGCRVYTEGSGASAQDVTITGFEKLCRAEAVGCRPVIDTQNTDQGSVDEAEVGLVYNALCKRGTGSDTLCNVNYEDGKTYSCTFEKGADECFVEGPVYLLKTGYQILELTDGSQIIMRVDTSVNPPPYPQYPVSGSDKLFVVTSSVVILEDSPTQYLAVQEEVLCNPEFLGCQKMGKVNQVLPNQDFAYVGTYTYSDTFILNNPTHYTQTLCVEEQVGCQEFKHNNTIEFFKDPTSSGSALCVYKEKVEIGGIVKSGWFIDGSVGKCSVSQNLCQTNDDCPNNFGVKGNTCENIGLQPCYPDYIKPGPEFGLWSNGSENYDNFVGACTPEYSGCTELIDPADTSGDPEGKPSSAKATAGKPYYAINDDRLFARTGECDSKASQKEGCILFDMTENPNKIYSAKTTYKNSTAQNYGLVKPVAANSTFVGDSNTLIKVNRDRECSEWLACKQSQSDTNADGVKQKLCANFQACTKLDAKGDCVTWVDYKEDNSRLTTDKYRSREVAWSDPDYSGFSLHNKYNPSNYVYLTFPNHDVAFLAYEMDKSFFAEDGEFVDKGCSVYESGANKGELRKESGQKCGFDDGGRCYNDKCLYPISGVFTKIPTPATGYKPGEPDKARQDKNIEIMLSELEPGTCKAHPESDGPFDPRVAVVKPDDIPNKINSGNNDSALLGRYEYKNIYPKFADANICQINSAGKLQDCSCDYIKVEYKNGVVDYWHTDDADQISDGICSGNPTYEGQVCNSDEKCNFGDETTGQCIRQAKKSTYFGLKGLCLEYDDSRPLGPYRNLAELQHSFACLTWLPVQVSASKVDLDNAYPEAGYLPTPKWDSPEEAGRVYCTESTNLGRGYFDQEVTFPIDTAFDELTGVLKQSGEISVYSPANFSDVDSLLKYVNIFNQTKYDGVFSLENSQSVPGYKGVDLANFGYYDIMSYESGIIPYRAMQLWAWKNIGTNARLLRIDRQTEHNYYLEYPGKNYTAAVYSFGPRGDSLDNEKAGDTGTLMHPPRIWTGNIENINSGAVTGGVYNYFMDSKIDGETDIRVAETTAFSPEAVDNGLIQIDQDFERNLNEYNVKRIYFVPLRYTGGGEGALPPILTPKFTIDVEELRNALQEDDAAQITGESTDWDGGEEDQPYLFGTGDTNAFHVSYILQRTAESDANCANGLGSYCTYDSSSGPNGLLIDQAKNVSSRNKVYRRYVALYYYKEALDYTYHPFDFHTNLTPPITENGSADERDPFSVACTQRLMNSDGETEGPDNTWIAIGMDFNEQGEFLGYISRFCDGANNEGGEGGGIRFATIAELQDSCTEMVSVYEDDVKFSGTSNKAWTDRVWKEAPNDFPVLSTPDSGDYGLKKNSVFEPFASLALPSWAKNKKLDNTRLEEYDTNEPDDVLLDHFSFSSGELGAPYSCKGDGIPGSSDDFNNRVFVKFPYNCSALPTVFDSYNLAKVDFEEEPLSYLFQNFFTILNVKDSTTKTLDNSSDISYTSPPQIYSLNPYLCAQSSDSECYLAEQDSFTVNKRNYRVANYDQVGSTSDEDTNGVNGIDPIIGTGSLIATAEFFAWADDNRMPIRRVMVDWGVDGEDPYNADKMSMYKNRKPYCAGSGAGRCVPFADGTSEATWISSFSQATCNSDAQCAEQYADEWVCSTNSDTTSHFGDADRACEQDWFSFENVYGCDISLDNKRTVAEINIEPVPGMFPDEASRTDAYETLKTQHGLAETDPVCIFKPRVQVLDNWGWCNGGCLDVNGKKMDGCYSNFKFAGQVNDQCKSEETNEKAWTYYNGAIIVIPS